MKYIERRKGRMTLERDIWNFLCRKTSIADMCNMYEKLENIVNERLTFKHGISHEAGQ